MAAAPTARQGADGAGPHARRPSSRSVLAKRFEILLRLGRNHRVELGELFAAVVGAGRAARHVPTHGTLSHFTGVAVRDQPLVGRAAVTVDVSDRVLGPQLLVHEVGYLLPSRVVV